MCFVAPPRPLDPGVGMTSPIDNLRQSETCSCRAADDGERIPPSPRAAVLLLGWQRRHSVVRRPAGRRCALCARSDQARLQLAHEDRAPCQRLRQLASDAPATCGTLGYAAKAVSGALDERVAFQNFLACGS